MVDGWRKRRRRRRRHICATRRRTYLCADCMDTAQSCPAKTLVAQVSNLLYRGFPIRRPWKTPASPNDRDGLPNGIRRYSRLGNLRYDFVNGLERADPDQT